LLRLVRPVRRPLLDQPLGVERDLLGVLLICPRHRRARASPRTGGDGSRHEGTAQDEQRTAALFSKTKARYDGSVIELAIASPPPATARLVKPTRILHRLPG